MQNQNKKMWYNYLYDYIFLHVIPIITPTQSWLFFLRYSQYPIMLPFSMLKIILSSSQSCVIAYAH